MVFFKNYRQKISNFFTSLKEKPWDDKVSSNLILKIIARQKNSGQKEKLLVSLWNKAISKYPILKSGYLLIVNGYEIIKTYLIQWRIFSAFHKILEWSRQTTTSVLQYLQYPASLFLMLLVYLLVWHPGLHNRPLPIHPPTNQSVKKNTIPPRPKVYPVDSVRLEIDSASGWLNLWMQGKKILSYPTSARSLSKGNYRIVTIQKQGKNTIIYAMTDSSGLLQSSILIKGSGILVESVPYIEVDDDLWETLLPYMKQNMPVIIR